MCATGATAQHYHDFTTPRPMPPESFLVIGFAGGVEHWNTPARPIRKLALDLREQKMPRVYVETVEHEHRGLALKLIVEALDRNRDGRLDAAERLSARIILYGHSMGGAGVVKLARELQERGIPVLLTVQVDSVGAHDGVIPSNVARAANFYQHTSRVLRGVGEIRAADPAATTILGNFRYDYRHRDIDLSGATLAERMAGTAHTKMEFDPEVWSRVQELIVQEIRRGAAAEAGR
jgi:pimeloyl-ACP methyl ester carboxylesterase